MLYYTGMLALSQYAKENEESVGIGSEAGKYLLEKEKYQRDSDNMILGKWDIYKTDTIPTGEEIWCASHERAYCDMLEEHRFDELKSLFETHIKSYKVMTNVFSDYLYKGLSKDKQITQFLNEEFGTLFRSYLLASTGGDKILGELMKG